MAMIAEETAVMEQPESVQPRESAKSEGAWGCRRRRKGAAVSESFTEGLDNSSERLQEQSQHAETNLKAAAAADQHATQPAAEHDRLLAQDATQTAPALPKVQQSLSIGPSLSMGLSPCISCGMHAQTGVIIHIRRRPLRLARMFKSLQCRIGK